MTISVPLITAIFAISFVLRMVGLGGGLIFSPLFVLLGFAKSQAASASMFLNLIAAASSNFIMCFSSLAGFLGYASMAKIHWMFILPAALASFAGGQAGSRLMSSRLEGKSIRVIFSIILFILCVKLLHLSFIGS